MYTLIISTVCLKCWVQTSILQGYSVSDVYAESVFLLDLYFYVSFNQGSKVFRKKLALGESKLLLHLHGNMCLFIHVDV